MNGIVTIAQESRFQLTAPDGVSHLFLLSWKASLDPGQLTHLQRDQAHVSVKYTAADNVIGLLARRVTRMDQ